MNSIPAALIHVRLKGFVKPETLGVMADALISQGWVDAAKLGLRLTPAGRAAADAAWHDERSRADQTVLESAHGQFVAINADFKALVAGWQIRDGVPNDHSDASYDAAIVTKLEHIDAAVHGVIASIASQVPRMAQYGSGFSKALSRIKTGEIRWMAAPIIDSYHTLWFEFHEELIRLTGRTRAVEAAAGTAA